MVAFAWCALAVFTVAVIALVVLLARALFRAIDRVDRVREELFSMAKTVETMAVRLERIESDLGEGDARLGELRADLRSSVRRDIRELLEGTGSSAPSG